jgi:hypothetical protein
MKATIQPGSRKVWPDGTVNSNGTVHWKKVWTVIVECDTEKEAMNLVDKLRREHADSR